MHTLKTHKLLRVYLSESDKKDGKLLYDLLLLKAKSLGLIGATVLRGIAGFGTAAEIHSARFLEIGESLPVLVEFVDTRENLDKIIPYILETAPKKLMILQDITILKS